MGFLKNIWYLVAWSEELEPQSMLARTIAGQPLVLIRNSDGAAAALLDMCPHRFAPLSRGTVTAVGVQCGYHGLAFDMRGACVFNPHGPIVSALKVRAFPLVERHSAIWVWLGSPEVKNEGAIPDLSFIDAVPGSARVTGYLHTQGGYQLMTDNIMDLTHADYLHSDTLGGGINTRAKGRMEQGEGSVTMTWEAKSDRLPPLMAALMSDPDAPADFHDQVQWFPPGVMKQRVLFGPAGRLMTDGLDSWTAHVMTPETERSTHYFFCHTSDKLISDPTFGPVVKQALLRAFQTEDAPMIEAQQLRLGSRSFEEQRPALLAIDSAAVAVRRHMSRLLDSEG